MYVGMRAPGNILPTEAFYRQTRSTASAWKIYGGRGGGGFYKAYLKGILSSLTNYALLYLYSKVVFSAARTL